MLTLLKGAISMKELRDILYGEEGILFRIRSGFEGSVTEEEKEKIVALATQSNKKFLANELEAKELMIYIDMIDFLLGYSDIDWIDELITDVTEHLIRNANLLH